MIEYKSRFATRNEEIVEELRQSVGASAPMDPKTVVKRKAAEISTLMALAHGGDWRIVIDHQSPMVLIRPV